MLATYLIDPQPPFNPPSENPDPRLPVTPPPDPTGNPALEPDGPEKPLPDNAPELPDRPEP